MYVDLEKIKKHLNIDSDFTEDDDYILMLYDVAETMIQKHIDKTFDEFIEEEGSVPLPLLHAILLYIGNMYANRESITYGNAKEIPLSLQYILTIYRDYTDANI